MQDELAEAYERVADQYSKYEYHEDHKNVEGLVGDCVGNSQSEVYRSVSSKNYMTLATRSSHRLSKRQLTIFPRSHSCGPCSLLRYS